MRLIFTTFSIIFLTAFQLKAAVGIFSHAINVNGTSYTSNSNLGNVAPNALTLQGGTASSWQNSGDDVCTVYLDYSVSGGGPSGTITLNYTSAGAGADKNWGNTGESINISGLANGTYTLTGGFRIMGRFGGVTCFGSGNEFNTSALQTLTLTFTVNSALPVVLTSFKAQTEARGIALHWATAQEWNSSHFEIERSANGIDWNMIGRTDAANYSSSLVQYQFTDDQPLRGKNYYRLRQIDLDGKFAHSAVVLASTGKQLEVRVYPNPVQDVLHVVTEEATQLELFDAQGRLVQSWLSTTPVTLTDLESGLYQLRITTEAGVETTTIVKQ